MLTIPYALRPTLHGLGVFATKNILRGQAVYRREPTFTLCLPRSQFDSLPENVRTKMLSYTYFGKGEHRLQHAMYFDADDSRFLNHSSTPNLMPVGDGNVYLAREDIAAGEELCCDYRDFSEPGDPALAFLETSETSVA